MKKLILAVTLLFSLSTIHAQSLFQKKADQLYNELSYLAAADYYKSLVKTDTPTEEGKRELVEKIKEIINCDFEIVKHFAGVRPTVKDRRPLVGTYVKHNSIHILNGLGTRGVMLGPAMAKALFENIEYQKPLDSTIDIKRFIKKS